MPTIILSEPWTYRTPLATIEFPAGMYEVADDVAAAAPPVPTTEEDADGDWTSAPGASGHSITLEG